MPIAIDAFSNANSGGGTSITVSHTCTGSNRILFAFVKCGSVPSGDLVNGVTYGGEAMTFIAKLAQSANYYFYAYYKINPLSGANNLVATTSASAGLELDIFGASYTGARQSGVPDSSNTATLSASPKTISTTTVADLSWLVGHFCTDNGASVVASTNTTMRKDGTYAGGVVDSNGAKTPAGSYSLVCTSASGQISGIVLSFAPALGGLNLSLMGVGQ